MKEELIKRLLGQSLEDNMKGNSNLRLGATSRRGVLNVKKAIYDKAASEDSAHNCISYRGGFAAATNGHVIFINSENYSKVYEDMRVNYISGETYAGIKPTPKQYAGVIEGIVATHYIESDDLLTAINDQVEQYNQIKKVDKDIAESMKNGKTGQVCLSFKDYTITLNMNDCRLIRRFLENCKRLGDYAIGLAPFQCGVLKIIGEGIMMIMSTSNIAEEYPELTVDTTDKVKPINK